MIDGRVTAKPGAFVAAVKWAAKFLETRPAVPIQGGLLLSIDDGRLSVLGYNENVTARAVVEIEGNGTGQAVVSGRLLAELANTFPAKPVTIEGREGDQSITITVGGWRGTLPAFMDGEFPSPPPPPAVIGRVPGEAFAAAIRRVAVARSDNPDALLCWHLLHLTFGEHEVVAMATDSYRAARETMSFDPEDDAAGLTALIYADTMLDAADSFTGPDEVWVGLNDSAIGLASPTRAVIMRQIPYPEYPLIQVRGLFAAKHPEHAQVEVKDLHGPLKRAVIMRDKKQPITVRFAGDSITLAAESEVERRTGDEEVAAKYSAAPWALRFNPGYFADALASAPGETVDIELTTEKVSGIILTVPGNDDWRHLLMPIKR